MTDGTWRGVSPRPRPAASAAMRWTERSTWRPAQTASSAPARTTPNPTPSTIQSGPVDAGGQDLADLLVTHHRHRDREAQALPRGQHEDVGHCGLPALDERAEALGHGARPRGERGAERLRRVEKALAREIEETEAE